MPPGQTSWTGLSKSTDIRESYGNVPVEGYYFWCRLDEDLSAGP
jgi:hypothetical protein